MLKVILHPAWVPTCGVADSSAVKNKIRDDGQFRRENKNPLKFIKIPLYYNSIFLKLKAIFTIFTMKKLKIGLVGLGTVGKSVYEILTEQSDIVNPRSANKIELKSVAARSKKDFIDEKKVTYVENILDIANDPEIDVVIEAAGGQSEIIVNLWETALKNGKKIITANKALMADQGLKMVELAEKHGGYIAYEAAIAGAIPIVKHFKEGLSANKITSFYGILNGTCNYILTKMRDEGISFAIALKQAQEAGYAEADPTFDVEGIDAAHKLSLLSAITSSTKPNFDKLYIEGISKISSDDIKLATEFGYKIKLLGIYKDNGKSTQQSVYPALVEKSTLIASIEDSFNAVFIQGNNCGDNLIVGRGAGGPQTASAIVADLIDIANDRHSFEFGVKSDELKDSNIDDISSRIGKYFLRLNLDTVKSKEVPLSKEFFETIKVKSTSYHENQESNETVCGILTEEIAEKEIKAQIEKLNKSLVRNSNLIRVEEIK